MSSSFTCHPFRAPGTGSFTLARGARSAKVGPAVGPPFSYERSDDRAVRMRPQRVHRLCASPRHYGLAAFWPGRPPPHRLAARPLRRSDRAIEIPLETPATPKTISAHPSAVQQVAETPRSARAPKPTTALPEVPEALWMPGVQAPSPFWWPAVARRGGPDRSDPQHDAPVPGLATLLAREAGQDPPGARRPDRGPRRPLNAMRAPTPAEAAQLASSPTAPADPITLTGGGAGPAPRRLPGVLRDRRDGRGRHRATDPRQPVASRAELKRGAHVR